MNEDEIAVWSALYAPCSRCYSDFDRWEPCTWRNDPPLPEEMAGWCTDLTQSGGWCNYCVRIDDSVCMAGEGSMWRSRKVVDPNTGIEYDD